MKIFHASLFVLLLLGPNACSGSRYDYTAQDFEVQYYTVGGVSGMTEGMTVSGTGWVKFWRGRNVQMSVVSDSIKLDEKQFNKIAELTKVDEIYSYQSQSSGELYSVINIRHEGRTNTITYSGTILPDSAPAVYKDLIGKLNQISKPTH